MASTTDYVELRCRSAFSFLSGASLPEDLVQRAAALEYPVLACGDRDGLYGAPRFHKAAQQAGLRALIGCEVVVCGSAASRPARAAPPDGAPGTSGTSSGVPSTEVPGYRKNQSPLEAGCTFGTSLLSTQHSTFNISFYVLVANPAGYKNLCRLLTQSKLRSPKGEAYVGWEDLEPFADGLICLAGGTEGPLAAALRAGADAVEAMVGRLRGLFGDRLYVDLQRHLDAREERLNRQLLAVARQYGLPVAATNDVRHATADDKRLLDVLTCIREKLPIDEAGRRLLGNCERHLKPRAEMAALFRDLPEALINTRRIAERCEFTLADLGYRFPEYPLPPGQTMNGELRELTMAGARDRYGTLTPRVRTQLEHELAVIAQLDLAGYFLIVWDIVRFCREQHILAQGRGSAANSAVCYALGITAVDAVGMELLFERFLSPERGEWPDIDIDLPSGEQREKVIQYVYRRYGERGAAMTANVITYRTRSAVREVGKVLGFSERQVDRLSKLLNRFEFNDDLDRLNEQLRNGGVDPGAPRVGLLVDMVSRIQNLPRHLGQHSGGMVIAAGRLDEVVPLEPASMPGRVVVQWDKDDCADLGIIKVDLLGLGMLAALEEAIPLIRTHEGVEIDLAHLPPDDPKTYDMLRRADTVGVFQVESRAQMATLPRMKPDHFYDLVVEVAIIRPGPVVGQMVHPYLERRNGRERIVYAHPLLEPILKRTLGVPLFQEQILRMAMVLAGFSGGEAEELRRAMGFKRSVARMQEIEARLRTGMGERGITGHAADEIVRNITSFALYGFPESHAASFALISYASAYLRAHHLAAFTCALLNNWPMGFYHPSTLVKDAQRHGLRVLPIDVTCSEWKCTLERFHTEGRRPASYQRGATPHVTTPHDTTPNTAAPHAITSQTTPPVHLRLGLRYVRGLREESARRLMAARSEKPFASVADVVHRAQLRADEMETLAHIGAFAPFGLNRRQALWQAGAVPRGELFARAATTPNSPERTHSTSNIEHSTLKIALPPMSDLDRTLADYRGTGLTVGPQIVAHLRPQLDAEKVLRTIDVGGYPNGAWVKTAGLVIVRQRPGTAKGFCFLTLEDETGITNAVVVPDMFEKNRALIHTAALLLVEGPLQKIDDVVHIRARRLRALELPRQPIELNGGGYRRRITPVDDQPAMPKSHDFR